MADPFSPFSAVVQKLSRKDGTSVLIALFLAYALVSFGIAAAVGGALRWLVEATGVLSFATGVAAFAYAFLVRPERLRSEEISRMDMVLTWLARPDIDDDHRVSAERLLPIIMETKRAKSSPGADKSQEGEDYE